MNILSACRLAFVCSRLFRLDQQPELTIYAGSRARATDLFCQLVEPFPAKGQFPELGRVLHQENSPGPAAAMQIHTLSVVGSAGPRVSSGSSRDNSQAATPKQVHTGNAYDFLSPQQAWEVVTCGARVPHDAALPYTAEDCFLCAFERKTGDAKSR